MICAIVLAAGRSQRMGTQKLLLPFANSSVIARVADAFLEAAVDQVIVVVRPKSEELREAMTGRPVIFVENADLAGDMLSSVRCGLQALPSTVKTIMVSPGDQPSIEPDLIRRMMKAFTLSDRTIFVPVYKNRRGHPLMFGAQYRNELLSSYDNVGLRGLLQTHAAEVGEWPANDAAVLEDLDTPAAFRRAQFGVSPECSSVDAGRRGSDPP